MNQHYTFVLASLVTMWWISVHAHWDKRVKYSKEVTRGYSNYCNVCSSSISFIAYGFDASELNFNNKIIMPWSQWGSSCRKFIKSLFFTTDHTKTSTNSASHTPCNEIEGSYDKNIIKLPVPSYTVTIQTTKNSIFTV